MIIVKDNIRYVTQRVGVRAPRWTPCKKKLDTGVLTAAPEND